MSLQTLRTFLLWCTVINLGLLLWWVLLFMLAHDWLHRLTNKWFRLPVEQFDGIHYAGMVFFKVGILLLNLVPCVVLHLVVNPG